MYVILISPPDYIEHEALLINRMFENNLSLMHLRKPDYDRKSLSVYLSNVNREYHSRIVIHSCYELLNDYNLRGIHITGVDKEQKDSIIRGFKNRDNISTSISCHTLDELTGDNKGIDYAFLSPVFDSISKSNYKAGFNHKELAETLEKIDIDVIALGGCKAEYLQKVKKMGFSGAAFLGAVWNSPDPVESYLLIAEAMKAVNNGQIKNEEKK